MRKKLTDKGESGDTFYAILDYATKYKPKMIILENVSGAPWDHQKELDKQKKLDKKEKEAAAKRKKNGEKPDDTKKKQPQTGIDKHFQDIGYSTIFMRMDTKDHYLAHTRVRGYMVCILTESYPDEEELSAALESFPTLIKELKRPPSVPIEAMLLPFDDPRLEGLSREEAGVTKRAATPWEKCKLGHQDYSVVMQLGTKRPLTHWNQNGSKVLPDYYKPTSGLTDRVLDSLDICHKRNFVVKGVDDRYYRYSPISFPSIAHTC